MKITLALPIKIKCFEKMIFDLEGKERKENYRKVLRLEDLNCVFTLSNKKIKVLATIFFFFEITNFRKN